MWIYRKEGIIKAMADKTFTIQISDLTKKEYTLRYWGEEGNVRFVAYKELRRESTRKRKYEVVRWYNWHNHRDRHDAKFIPVEQIELPPAIKQAFVHWLIEGLTFITRE
jgi:hypothetical protein